MDEQLTMKIGGKSQHCHVINKNVLPESTGNSSSSPVASTGSFSSSFIVSLISAINCSSSSTPVSNTNLNAIQIPHLFQQSLAYIEHQDTCVITCILSISYSMIQISMVIFPNK